MLILSEAGQYFKVNEMHLAVAYNVTQRSLKICCITPKLRAT